MDSSPIIELVKVTLPFISAVAGWFVASSMQDKRERRKEIRGIIDETKRCVQSSYELTMLYYSKKNKSPINELSAKLKFQNMLISQYFMILNAAGLKTGGSRKLIEFHKATTGDVFETSLYTQRFDDVDWQSNLSYISQEIMIDLEKSYFRQFKIKGMPSQIVI